MTHDEYLTVRQAASLLQVNPETLRRWDNEGKLSAIKINDRGDRRWRRLDILALIQNKTAGRTITHKDYMISIEGSGLITERGDFGLIIKYAITRDGTWTGCAFHCASFVKFKEKVTDVSFQRAAEEHIKNLINGQHLDEGIVSTFEYVNGSFIRVWCPNWWEGETPLLLVPGLRIVVNHFCQIAPRVEAWRCLLNFQSSMNDTWVKSQFGQGMRFTEYAVEVSLIYLEDHTDCSPNEQGMKTFALEHVRKRFDQTKNENRTRSIERITENRVACWGGKCQVGKHLPVELFEVKSSTPPKHP